MPQSAQPDKSLVEPLTVLEANIDDMPAELMAPLPETLIEAGARDAWLTPILMKKGRPGQLLSALCDPQTADAVERAMFVHSSTLGVRRQEVMRTSLAREQQTVNTPWGEVRVKIGRLGGDVVNRAPEFEDCRALAQQASVPIQEVYQAAQAAAMEIGKRA